MGRRSAKNADGRSKPIALTASGKGLLVDGKPAWLVAQAEAKEILGETGEIVLLGIAGRLLDAVEGYSIPAQNQDFGAIDEKARA